MSDTLDIQSGSIVRCRNRQWVVLPSENLDVVRLRSLSGSEDEITGIFQQLLSMQRVRRSNSGIN